MEAAEPVLLGIPRRRRPHHRCPQPPREVGEHVYVSNPKGSGFCLAYCGDGARTIVFLSLREKLVSEPVLRGLGPQRCVCKLRLAYRDDDGRTVVVGSRRERAAVSRVVAFRPRPVFCNAPLGAVSALTILSSASRSHFLCTAGNGGHVQPHDSRGGALWLALRLPPGEHELHSLESSEFRHWQAGNVLPTWKLLSSRALTCNSGALTCSQTPQCTAFAHCQRVHCHIGFWVSARTYATTGVLYFTAGQPAHTRRPAHGGGVTGGSHLRGVRHLQVRPTLLWQPPHKKQRALTILPTSRCAQWCYGSYRAAAIAVYHCLFAGQHSLLICLGQMAPNGPRCTQLWLNELIRVC